MERRPLFTDFMIAVGLITLVLSLLSDADPNIKIDQNSISPPASLNPGALLQEFLSCRYAPWRAACRMPEQLHRALPP